jgi:hypothetical protein
VSSLPLAFEFDQRGVPTEAGVEHIQIVQVRKAKVICAELSLARSQPPALESGRD